MADVNAVLGRAYELSVLGKSKPRAVEFLRQSLTDTPELLPDLRRTRAELSRVVAARSQNGVCGCFVSKATFDLLTEALED